MLQRFASNDWECPLARPYIPGYIHGMEGRDPRRPQSVARLTTEFPQRVVGSAKVLGGESSRSDGRGGKGAIERRIRHGPIAGDFGQRGKGSQLAVTGL